MSVRRVTSLIRRSGDLWTLSGSTSTFSGYLPTGKDTLSIPLKIALPVGSIINRQRDSQQYLVVDASNKLYSRVSLVKISCYADVFRFGDGQRDTFGRVIDPAPAPIAISIPLYRHPSATSSQQHGPDRSSTNTGYTFTTSTAFDIRNKDRLRIGNVSVVVVSVRLAGEGLTEFTAVEEA